MRLFCFPYAGGAAIAFRGWPDGLPASLEVWAVQLPGRGARMRESPYRQFTPLLTDLSAAIIPFLDIPFVFFGHSLGALIAFELSRLFTGQSGRSFVRLIVSGCKAPHLLDQNQGVSKLPDPEFVEKLRMLDGTPREVLENKELLQIFLPTIRADYSVFESYFLTNDQAQDTEFSIYGGRQDPEINADELEAWKIYTKAPGELKMFQGGHFFLQSSRALVLRSIAVDLGFE
jgi:medium-chain acyl-[acyl-carrier-protein] hydrolase